jgi:hypothetical protein
MPESPNGVEPTNPIVTQGRALVRAIEALDAIVPSGRLEMYFAKLLTSIYKHRLRQTLKLAPVWISEEIMSISEQTREDAKTFLS